MREKLSKGEKKNRVEVYLPNAVEDFDEFEKEPSKTFPPDEIAKEAKVILKDLEKEDEEAKKKSKIDDPIHKAMISLAGQSEEMIQLRDAVKAELNGLVKKKDTDSIERARVDKIKLKIIRQELKKVSDTIEDITDGDVSDLNVVNAVKIVNRRIAEQLVAPILEQVTDEAKEKTEQLLRVALKSRFKDRDTTRLTKDDIESLSSYVSVLAADKVKPFVRDHMSSLAYEEFVKTGSPLSDLIRDGMSEEMHKVYGKIKIEFLMAEIADYARKRKEIEEASKKEGVEVGNLSDAEVDVLWNKIQISKAREAKSLDLENVKRAEVAKTESKRAQLFEPFFNENFLHKEFVKFLAKSNFKEVPDSTNPYSKENCWFNPENYRVIKSRFLKEMFNENANPDARLRHELEIESFLQKQKRAYMVKVSGEKHIAEMEAKNKDVEEAAKAEVTTDSKNFTNPATTVFGRDLGLPGAVINAAASFVVDPIKNIHWMINEQFNKPKYELGDVMRISSSDDSKNEPAGGSNFGRVTEILRIDDANGKLIKWLYTLEIKSGPLSGQAVTLAEDQLNGKLVKLVPGISDVAKSLIISAPRRAFGWLHHMFQTIAERVFIEDHSNLSSSYIRDQQKEHLQENKRAIAEKLVAMGQKILERGSTKNFKTGDYVVWDQENAPVESRVHDIYKVVSVYSPYDKDEDNIHAELVTGPNKGVIYTFHPKYIKKVDLGQNPDVKLAVDEFLGKQGDALKALGGDRGETSTHDSNYLYGPDDDYSPPV